MSVEEIPTRSVQAPPPHFRWPRITSEIEHAVLQQLHEDISIYDKQGIFATFEDRFASMHEQRYALLCNSGTTAIHSMYVAAGLGRGDEVICPVYTFFATVTPLLFTGARPVFCDALDDGNINVTQVEQLVTSRTKAVVVTHMWGMPCDLGALRTLCDRHGLLLLEDCSHAHGARFAGKPVGSFGDIAVWSLQGPKLVTGGEGGVLATSRPDFYYRALALGHYNKRCRQEIPPDHELAAFATTGMGMKYRAHPLAVAIADVLLRSLDLDSKIRSNHAGAMIDAVDQQTDGPLSSPVVSSLAEPAWYAVVFRFDAAHASATRQEFVEALHADGLYDADIPTSTCPLSHLPLFIEPSYFFPDYTSSLTLPIEEYPVAEHFFRSAIKFSVTPYPDELPLVEAYSAGIVKVSQSFYH